VKDYDVSLQWHPFQLRPQTPEAGLPLSEVMPPEYLAQAEARLRQATSEVGLPYKQRDRIPNTHLAHEAALFAEQHGLGDAFHQAALRAYFGEGTWIGGVDELVAIGVGVGLDATPLRTALTERTLREAVDAAIASGQDHDISGVPAFIFAPGAVLSGAQPYEVFERAMRMFNVPKRGE
jgi:predicted DsbA family dithiol-disulfide isomerase